MCTISAVAEHLVIHNILCMVVFILLKFEGGCLRCRMFFTKNTVISLLKIVVWIFVISFASAKQSSEIYCGGKMYCTCILIICLVT